MGLIQAELSLNLKPTFVPQKISDFLKEVSLIGNVNERVSKIDAFVETLENEFKKIVAFKRELPLCMQLLKDAIHVLKEEARHCVALLNNVRSPKEFVSRNSDEGICKVKRDMGLGDKKNWIGMSSLGVCNADDFASGDSELDLRGNAAVGNKRMGCHKRSTPVDILELSGDENAKRASVPFKAYSGFTASKDVKEKEEELFSEHSLLALGIKSGERPHSSVSMGNFGRALSSCAQTVPSDLQISLQQPQQQPIRKQRRRWSTELHRRFVNALMELGGAQAATPKQIREHMNIDGLTNDEVKSHLQKYRLHGRRPSAGSATSLELSVAVSNGLWMPQDSSRASSCHSGSPLGPLQLARNNGETSITVDSIEGDEDEKSDSYSYNLKSSFYKTLKDIV